MAVTITLLLAGLMLAVVTGTLNVWHRTQDNFSTAAQAKLVLDMMERDLQAAVFRKDDGTWLAVDVINTPSALTNHGWLTAAFINPAGSESQLLLPGASAGFAPAIGNARFGLSGAWFRFITTNVESGGSLPVAVSYQVARRPLSGSISSANPSAVRYSLFRAAISAENAFAAGNEVTAAAYGSASANPGASRTAATLMNPNTTDALATNVVDIGVWLYVRDNAGGLRRVFPADNSDTTHAAHDGGGAADANRFPDAVEVMLRILTEQGATLLAEMEGGSGRITRPAAYTTDAGWWWAVVEANSHVYTRRVEVKGGAR